MQSERDGDATDVSSDTLRAHAMSDEPPLRPILRTLLASHQAALDLREHEVAFHALSAAGHAAEGLRDLEALREVERLATSELAWIDAHDAGHRHSTRSAKRRGHRSIFDQLAVTAAGMCARLEADRRLEQARRGR